MQDKPQYPPVMLSGTEVRTLVSKAVEEMEYKIFVAFPKGYDTSSESYPVLYFLDAWNHDDIGELEEVFKGDCRVIEHTAGHRLHVDKADVVFSAKWQQFFGGFTGNEIEREHDSLKAAGFHLFFDCIHLVRGDADMSYFPGLFSFFKHLVQAVFGIEDAGIKKGD